METFVKELTQSFKMYIHVILVVIHENIHVISKYLKLNKNIKVLNFK